MANEGQSIHIPDGCILENRLLSGNLNMIVSVVTYGIFKLLTAGPSGIVNGLLGEQKEKGIHSHLTLLRFNLAYIVVFLI